MTQFIYAVHLDNIGLHSLHHSWPSAETAISNIEYPVFRKFPAEDKEIAEHFSINGVLPINRITKTRHMFVSLINPTHYTIYTSCPDLFNNSNHKSGTLPQNWIDSSCDVSDAKKATSLYSLYDTLEALSHVQKREGPFQTPIVIHFDYFYPAKCVSEWIPFWKQTRWTKSDGKAVDNSILLQIIDAQLSNLENIHIDYVHDVTHKNGIYGFKQCKSPQRNVARQTTRSEEVYNGLPCL